MKTLAFVTLGCLLLCVGCASQLPKLTAYKPNPNAPQQWYWVGGYSRSPNRTMYTPGLTLTEAIRVNGGFTRDADRRRVALMRYGFQKPFLIDFDAIEHGQAPDILIRESDLIYIPRRSL